MADPRAQDHPNGGVVKALTGRWKYSKKRGVWIWKWKRRKVHGPVQIEQQASNLRGEP